MSDRTAADADDRLMRRAFELAVEVARRRTTESPPREMPAALRRFERFGRLSNSALAVVRRALEEDPEFLAEVAAAPEVDALPAPAALWLRRPPGWEERLAEVLAEAGAPAELGADPRLLRRLEGAERAQERERRRAEELEVQLDRLRAEHAALLSRATDAERERDELRNRVQELGDQRSRAVAELKRVEELLARRTAEHRALEDRLAGGTAALDPGVLAAAAAASIAAAETAATRARVEELAGLAATLREGLAALRADLLPAPATAVAAGRQPPHLPPGVVDETLPAAEHLLRHAGALVVVDGYNVAKLGWPSLPLAEQRDALVVALGPLAALPGAEVWVVFDGDDVDVPRGPVRPGAVQVRFSPRGVPADDVILDLVDRLPTGRRVVVVSNDRRVRDGARRAGARVVSSDHLLGVARR